MKDFRKVMLKIFVLFMLFCVASGGYASVCETNNKITLLYINGLHAPTTDSAVREVRDLEALFGDQFLYDSNWAPGSQIRNDILRRIRNLHNAQVVKTNELFIDYWRRELGMPPKNTENTGVLDEVMADAYRVFVNSFVDNAPGIDAHLDKYVNYVENNKPFIIVGYSLGSIYSSIGYRWIEANYPSDVLDIIGTMNVGSFAASVPGEERGLGDYVTINADRYVNWIRPFAEIVPGNLEYHSPDHETNGNHLRSVYFLESIPVSVFSTKLQRVSGAMAGNQSCEPEPEPVIPCGDVTNYSGGFEQYRQLQDLGSTPGNVHVQFEAYSIPDKLMVVSSNNNSFVNTGWNSGLHISSFWYDPNRHGAGPISVRVDTDNTDTQWRLFVGCPGQGTAGGLPIYDLNLSWSAISSYYTCSANFDVNGTLYNNTSFRSFKFAGGSNHKIRVDQSCQCNSSIGCFQSPPVGEVTLAGPKNNARFQPGETKTITVAEDGRLSF